MPTWSILLPTNILMRSCFVENVSSSFNQASSLLKDERLHTSYTEIEVMTQQKQFWVLTARKQNTP